jgi:hypothetical protein
VVECKGTGADITFTLAVQKLEAHLMTFDTAPPIITAIMTRIRQWQKHKTTTYLVFVNGTSTTLIMLWKARTRLAGTIFFLGQCQKMVAVSWHETIYGY